MNKIQTINLKGKEYATVPARLVKFREDCPNALIETTPIFLENKIMFKARILKDKSRQDSGEATGHSYVDGKGEKIFEKAETIAVGRALALLGYMASGDIASGEEMMEYNEYQEVKRNDSVEYAKEKLEEATSLGELKSIFIKLKENKFPEVIAYKDKLKKKYENT